VWYNSFMMNQQKTQIDEKALWEKSIAFHGHECGGLMIGFKASLYAIELLGIEFSADEQLVCISENDACGVDAIQVILGCSVGKGNLLIHLKGKQAYSFYNRLTGKSVRLILKDMERKDGASKLDFMKEVPSSELFEVKDVKEILPESARIFASHPCSICGEMTAEHMLHLSGTQKICPDCYPTYTRFR
jgi:formylmethanofuran dehydrogenase subunit E